MELLNAADFRGSGERRSASRLGGIVLTAPISQGSDDEIGKAQVPGIPTTQSRSAANVRSATQLFAN